MGSTNYSAAVDWRSLGPPGQGRQVKQLTLHGRIANLPAHRVEVQAGYWTTGSSGDAPLMNAQCSAPAGA